MKRGGSLKRRRRRPSKAEQDAHDRFRAVVTRQPCLFSTTRPGHECSGPLDPHHVVPAQYLKNHFSTLEDKWALIYSPDVGVPLCRAAHDPVTTHATYVFLQELPAVVIDFCEAWGNKHRLEIECPSLTAVGDVDG